MTALASPASLKGVLPATEAAAALTRGIRFAGGEAVALPVADGGEGTGDVLFAALGGEWHEAMVSDPLGRSARARWLMLPDRTAVVESAQAIGLARMAESENDPLHASSRGLGELIHAALEAEPDELLVGLGDSATVDGGAGLLEVLGGFPVPVVVACDVLNPLLGERGAARAFGPQKGASPEEIEKLERRLASQGSLAPFAALPGAGAAGGLGAALAALGAQLISGAELVLARIGFAERLAGAELVVTGEGTIDRSTLEGKAPGTILHLCAQVGVRCVLFGGRVEEAPPGTETYELEGGPERAWQDLEELGARLAQLLGE